MGLTGFLHTTYTVSIVGNKYSARGMVAHEKEQKDIGQTLSEPAIAAQPGPIW